MVPPFMATPGPEFSELASDSPDLTRVLERQIAAGFQPELAFDLVLHELVMRAASATHASGAALALARGSEMVCRAATGQNAPGLGVPLDTRAGLSGACLRSGQPQHCADTESDPRVVPEAARLLDIRSILVVPVWESGTVAGILEVFAAHPDAFSSQHQFLLEVFAQDCARLQGALTDMQRVPAKAPQFAPGEPVPELPAAAVAFPAPARRPAHSYEGWSLLVGTIAILVAIAVSFLIGSRVGWFRSSMFASPARPAQHLVPSETVPDRTSSAKSPAPAFNQPSGASGRSDQLVVYDHGKVVFRMKPEPSNRRSVVAASENKRLNDVWLAPAEAEQRVRSRIDPQAPQAALDTHRGGEVVLEIEVGADGSVVTARAVSGDPLLSAAALEAVGRWQYEPYLLNQRPTQFKTDVTVHFTAPE